MAAGRIVVPPYMPVRDGHGYPVSGAELYVYVNETTTLTTIYTDFALTIPAANPLSANTSGVFPTVFAEAGTEADPVLYSYAVTDSSGRAPGRPSVFDNYRPSVDYETATLILAEQASESAQFNAEASAEALAEIIQIAKGAPDAPSVVNKAPRYGTFHNGVERELINKAGDVKHLYDFCAPTLQAQIEAGTATDVTAELQAYFDTANDGYRGVTPPRVLPVSSQVSIGNGTSTTRSSISNCSFVSAAIRGTDDGYFGDNRGTRIKYVGPRDPSIYVLKVAGPIVSLELLDIVVDCNGRAGYAWDFAHLMQSHVRSLATHYITGAGRAYVYDVATLPAGVTVGFMDNHMELWWRRPTDINVDPTQVLPARNANGLALMGGPVNNRGFSRNRFSCWGQAGGNTDTFGLSWNFIDNNRFDHLFLDFADGGPVSGTNVGYGLKLIKPSTGGFSGFSPWENHIQQSVIIPPYLVVDDTGAAATLRNAQFRNSITAVNVADGEPDPPEGFIWTNSRGAARGSTAAMSPILGRSLGNLNATSPWFYSPEGSNIGGVNRFEAEMQMNQAVWLTGFGVNLGNAPGGATTRTFVVHVAGTDTAFTVTFGPTEFGTKVITTPTSLSVSAASGISVKETHTGSPAASGASWTITIEPTEAW